MNIDKAKCTNCDHAVNLLNGEELSEQDRCSNCGAVGTLIILEEF